MPLKWLIREGERWIKDGIVTREQLDRIIALYEPKERSVGILPVLGGLFLGLSLLSLVAANWQAIPSFVRIALILLLMVGCYLLGWRLIARGNGNLGAAVTGIGLFAFGGGIVLIEQMFHMMHFSAFPLVVWAAAGVALTYICSSRYLFILSVILLTVAQGYSVTAFNGISLPALAVLVAGLAPFVLRYRHPAVTSIWSLTAVVHSLMLVVSKSWDFGWFFVPLMLLYVAGDLLKERNERIAMQVPPLAAAFLFSLAAALINWQAETHWATEAQADPAVYIPLFILLLAGSLYAKFRAGGTHSIFEWLVFLPVLYMPPAAIAIGYLAILFLFSLLTLLEGYARESRSRINTGTGLFLIATMAAYFKLTWAFMDKALFFLIGGGILLLLSWLLNMRKRFVIGGKKEE